MSWIFFKYTANEKAIKVDDLKFVENFGSPFGIERMKWKFKMSSPPKITAEWIVRAQLTISRPETTSKLRDSNSSSQSNLNSNSKYDIERHFDDENPIKVVYKWSSSEANHTGDSSSAVETVLSAPNNIASNVSSKDSGSFRSSGVPSTDSGIGTTTKTCVPKCQIDKSKYRSTCNIILTACTNVIPEPNEVVESFPTTYYTLFPDDEVSLTQHARRQSASNQLNNVQMLLYSQACMVQSNLSKQNILSMRDAFSQTNDSELKKYAANDSFHSHNSHNSLQPNSKHKDERNAVRVNLKMLSFLQSNFHSSNTTFLTGFSVVQ